MATFDLREKTVGRRLIRAIQKSADEGENLSLFCVGATFVDAFGLDNATLTGADFSEPTFRKPVRFRNVTCTTEVAFDNASANHFHFYNCRFQGVVGFRGVEASSLYVKSADFDDYASFDDTSVGNASFRDVRFAFEARFRKFQARDAVSFRSVTFSGAASFQEGASGSLSFPNCKFRGPLQTRGWSTRDSIKILGSRLEENSELELAAQRHVELRDTTFLQPIALELHSPVVSATATTFERGADIQLPSAGSADLSHSSFLGPSIIATQKEGAEGAPAKLTSLDRTRIDRLTLQGLDLSGCRFGRLHRVEGVLIAGRGQLALAPEVIEGTYRREVIADEAVRRSTEKSQMLKWADVRWSRPSIEAAPPVQSASEIADIYRAMRKAREDAKDYPGAADFYYGEMEMRREGAENWLERSLLTLYWAVSGYGLRAARSLLTLLFALGLLCVAFQAFGFIGKTSISESVSWTVMNSVSLAHPAEGMHLTSAGMYLSVAARVGIPALLALTFLALRSRVKR